MRKLEVQKFIEQHPDWEKLLVEKPYCLKISHEEMFGHKLVMLKYDQIESSFYEPIVCECRGLVLDDTTNEVISFPFTKFFNFGEPTAATIDWKTAKVGQKVDGSLIKIVRLGDDVLISTNGTLDAFKAPVAEQIGCKFKSFGDIVKHVIVSKFGTMQLFISQLRENFTYMFELVSPYTRVVIPYKEADLWYLVRRDNISFQEEHFSAKPFGDIFKVPEVFPLSNVDQCLAATRAMPWDEEGYVVCDANFNRVKIKSPSYLAVHNLKGEGGVMSYRRAIEIVRANEIDEICSYFEEFRPALEECKAKFWKIVEETENAWNEYLKIDDSLPTRKDKALWITKNFKMPGIAFGLLDKKIASVKDFFMNVPTDKLLRCLGYKE